MKSPKFSSLLLVVAIALSQIYQSCSKKDMLHPNPIPVPDPDKKDEQVDNKMVVYWNDRAATVLGIPMRQPDRSRYFAIIEIAVHDALNNVRPRFERYIYTSPQPAASASADAAVASAAYWAIVGLNLQGSFPIDDWYDSCLATIKNDHAREAGKVLGQKAAEAIIANRSNDGYTQVIATSFDPPDGTLPGVYRQTNAIPFRVIPNWGTVLKPWVVESNTQFRPGGPYAVQSAEYAADYNEIKAKGGLYGSTRTDQETRLARFWAENRISIIWNDFANKVIANKKMDAWATARLFALLHTAMADGFNTVLESKYHFYYWRPETAIHEGDNDENPATSADGAWIPSQIETVQPTPPGNWVSPPVPEYPSSYAMAGGITAKILVLVTGENTTSIHFTSSTLPGTTLYYTSIEQAAIDNALAKIYAGWYFRKAALDGEEMGENIASFVFAHSFNAK